MNTFRSVADRARAIAELAYQFWEERGCPEGSPEEDWYKAELNIDREQDPEGGKEKTLRTLHEGKPDKKPKR
jgi:hypothetical protein